MRRGIKQMKDNGPNQLKTKDKARIQKFIRGYLIQNYRFYIGRF